MAVGDFDAAKQAVRANKALNAAYKQSLQARGMQQGLNGIAQAQQGGQLGSLQGHGLQSPYASIPNTLAVPAYTVEIDPVTYALDRMTDAISALEKRIAALEAALNPSAPNKDAPLLRAIKR